MVKHLLVLLGKFHMQFLKIDIIHLATSSTNALLSGQQPPFPMKDVTKGVPVHASTRCWKLVCYNSVPSSVVTPSFFDNAIEGRVHQPVFHETELLGPRRRTLVRRKFKKKWPMIRFEGGEMEDPSFRESL